MLHRLSSPLCELRPSAEVDLFIYLFFESRTRCLPRQVEQGTAKIQQLNKKTVNIKLLVSFEFVLILNLLI